MYTLVITSTVHVNSDLTVLTDPEIRKQQYIESILFYLHSKMVSAIIVTDNSGFDHSKDESLIHAATKTDKRIEFLHFTGDNNNSRIKGKGWGEGEIMAYTFLNSRLLESAGSFVKVTGRICVLNIDAVLKKTSPDNTHFQKAGVNPFANQKMVDTRFYHCGKKAFEKYLMDAYLSVNDREGYYLEHAYYEHLKRNHVPYTGFNVLPRFKGISGSTGESYTKGKLRWLVEKTIYTFSKHI